jgi:hypothetical protein
MGPRAVNGRDGEPKYLTRDCEQCPFFLRGQGAERLLHRHRFPTKFKSEAEGARRFCIWGASVKTLVPTERPKRCGLTWRTSPGVVRWAALIKDAPDLEPRLFAET